MRIVIFGGGFIGRHLTASLATAGHELVLPVRDREKVKNDLILLPNTDVIACNPANIQSVLQPLDGADAVVNLVGILNERQRGDFERTHCEFVRILINGCIDRRIYRFVHLSALNAAAAAPSAYLRSKAKAEQIIKEASSIRHVIVRPSVVFGEGDQFINLFVRLARLTPIVVLPCATANMQPLAVTDLVQILARVLKSGEADNKTLSVGGPEILTLADIVRHTFAAADIKRSLIGLNPASSYLVAAIAEYIPKVNFLSRDNCLSAKIPSVCGSVNDAQELLGTLTTLDAGLAAMFAPHTDAAYSGLREHSRR
jgi:NADH dehydrogenase